MYDIESNYVEIWLELTPGAREELHNLFENGPVWDGDLISKHARDELLEKRLASKAVVKAKDGYQVATYRGAAVFRAAHDAANMKPNDAVEFMSDRQTDKGPSGGTVLDRTGTQVRIRHSDAVQAFDVTKLRVKNLTARIGGGAVWILE